MGDVGAPLLRYSSLGQLDGAGRMNSKGKFQTRPHTILTERYQREVFPELQAQPVGGVAGPDEDVQRGQQ